MKHFPSIPNSAGFEECLWCFAKRNKKHGIEVGTLNVPANRRSSLVRGWVLNGKPTPRCPQYKQDTQL